MTPSQGAIVVLATVLAISVAGNAWLFHDRTQLLVRDGAVTQLAKDTKGAADACSAGVDGLAKDSKARGARIEKTLQGETGRILELQHESLDAQRARPANPADLCGSLDVYLTEQIRKKRAGAAK